MNASQPTPGVDQEWLNPSVDEQGLARYATTIRERKWLILATVLVTTLAAVLYLATASKVYQAESDLRPRTLQLPSGTPSGGGLPGSRELWKYGLIGALGLLTVEWWWFHRKA